MLHDCVWGMGSEEEEEEEEEEDVSLPCCTS
jgi:hypothetical protein